MLQTDLRDVGRGWEGESNTVDVEGDNGHAADAAAVHHGLHRHSDIMNEERTCGLQKMKFFVGYNLTNIHLHSDLR